jgi:hypothetical protein
MHEVVANHVVWLAFADSKNLAQYPAAARAVRIEDLAATRQNIAASQPERPHRHTRSAIHDTEGT